MFQFCDVMIIFVTDFIEPSLCVVKPEHLNILTFQMTEIIFITMFYSFIYLFATCGPIEGLGPQLATGYMNLEH